MSFIEIDICNSLGDNKVPNATRIANSSKKYNCHSYAWYMQSTENPYWMPDPSVYYTDGSYFEVSMPCVGDKVCYFNANGTNEHSGTVISVSDGEITVRSKWGAWGLYEHNLYDCPYTSYYGGTADIIKYYHRHDYNNYDSYNTTFHTKTCACGSTETERHTFTYKFGGGVSTYSIGLKIGHTATCECGYSEVQDHTWASYTPPKSLISLFYAGDDCYAVTPNLDRYVKCIYCGHIRKLGNDEVVPIVPWE